MNAISHLFTRSEMVFHSKKIIKNVKRKGKSNFLVFWLLLCILGPVIRASVFQRRRDPTAFSAIDDQAFIAIILTLLGLITLILSKQGQQALTKCFKSPLKFLIYYYVFCGVSSLWSSKPEYSIFRALEMLVNITLPFCLFEFIADKKVAARYLLVIIVSSVVCGLLFYLELRGYIFAELHSNAYPSVAAMGIVFCLGNLMHYNLLSLKEVVFGACFFGVALLFGSSSSSIVSATVGLLLLLSMKKRRKLSTKKYIPFNSYLNKNSARKQKITAGEIKKKHSTLLFKISPIKIVFIILIVWGIYNYAIEPAIQILFPDKTTQDITTMTGRTGFWKIYLQGFLDKPILGWGFPTGEKEADRFGFAITSSAHNGIISVAINTGVVGLLLFFTALVKIFTAFIKAIQSGKSGASFLMVCIIVGLVNNMTYPLIGSQWFWPTTSLLSLLAFSNCYLFQKIGTKNSNS